MKATRIIKDLFTDLFKRDWRELRYDFSRLTSHIMWHVRAIYAPYNRMKIRNTTRKYCFDSESLLFHAAFTILCNHVEQCEGGRSSILEKIKQNNEPSEMPECTQSWAKAFTTMLSLYDWYTGIDWDDPVPSPKNEDAPQEEWTAWAEADIKFHSVECQERLKELIEVRPYMWT